MCFFPKIFLVVNHGTVQVKLSNHDGEDHIVYMITILEIIVELWIDYLKEGSLQFTKYFVEMTTYFSKNLCFLGLSPQLSTFVNHVLDLYSTSCV